MFGITYTSAGSPLIGTVAEMSETYISERAVKQKLSTEIVNT